jgi:hypothetical protein
MGIDDRIDSEMEDYHRPGGAGGTPREIPDPTDEDFIEIVTTLYDAIGHDVEVFAQAGVKPQERDAEPTLRLHLHDDCRMKFVHLADVTTLVVG